MRKKSIKENEEFDLPTQEEGEDAGTILAEMTALQAIFDANLSKGTRERALALARQALKIRPAPTSTEGRVTVVALSHCIGVPRRDLALLRPEKSLKPFEALASHWMRWLTMGDMAILGVISMLRETLAADKTKEGLSLSFWAQGLELLSSGKPEEAKRFFDQATEIGAQAGTNSNPSICWTYASSYFLGPNDPK